VEGLQGLPEAIAAVCPQTPVQLCIVQKMRHSLTYVSWQDCQAVATALRAIYGAATLPEAEQALERCAARWEATDPAISPRWLTDWDRLTVLCDALAAMRRVI
jgi:transposase-like protein